MKSELFLASETGNISAFRNALNSGFNINEVDDEGTTALMIACKFGHTALAKFIISKGAEIDLSNNNGTTAFKIAKLSNKAELLDLFKEYVEDDTESGDILENFDVILKNISPVSKQIEPILKNLNKEQRIELKNDLLKTIVLSSNQESYSIYDCYSFGLASMVFYEPFHYLDVLEKHKTFSESQRISFAEKIFELEKDGFQNNEISFENFVLNSINNLTFDNQDKMKKAFYEFAEIIVKADGIVTEYETKTLKFLSTTFSKAINETKTLQTNGFSKTELNSILKELNNLVGMENIKDDILSLINIINVNKLRSKEGLPEQKLSLHSVFIGPPGTGKTTIARILSNIYHSLELLPENNFVETDRSGLVAGYVGQTAIKTDEIINKAKNGILFIDEAYTLKRGNSDNDYGQEAIDILLKRMEDSRENLIIIVAGYETEMNHFINSNPGLKSRFNRYFHFNDYNSTELTEIYKRIADKSGFILKEEAQKRLNNLFENLCSTKDDKFGNARLARNIFEKTFEKHANRTSTIAPITRDILTTIEEVDIPFNEFINAN
ncbi:MAG: AAA family ATPase [Flavobacterium sp.]|nr:AAA family ATPase [Flavobacterium sp.]